MLRMNFTNRTEGGTVAMIRAERGLVLGGRRIKEKSHFSANIPSLHDGLVYIF